MPHRDIKLYCLSLRAYHCRIRCLVTIFVYDLPHYIKNRKKSYRLSDDDVINMQTSLKIHIQFYPTSAMACRSTTLVLWAFILMMTKNFKLVLKKVKNAAIDYIMMTPSAINTDTVKR